MKKTLLIKNIHSVVTCDDEDRILHQVNLFIQDGVIKSMDETQPQADRVIDGSNLVLYPGLINTHHHLYQILTRNLPQVQNLELFDWLRTLYQIWKNLDSRAVYDASLAGMAELAKYGCTTVFDHHYVFPRESHEFLDAQFAAARQLGVRFTASRGSMDLSEKDGGLPPDSVVQTVTEILTASEEAVRKHHDPKPFSMNQIVLAPCSPFSVSADLMRETASLARSLDVRLHTHLAETRDENSYLVEKLGMRPLAYMQQLGWVGPDVWYAHGIHFNDAELRILAETQTGVAHCPASNMKLSSGVARIPEMLAMGIPVGLAVDGSASNDGSSLMEEMRLAYLLHRLTSAEKAPSGYEILKVATRGSARLLGRTDIGQLKVGMAGDFFAIDRDRLELAGAALDVASMLSTVGLKGPVDYTVTGGHVIVDRGNLVGIEEGSLCRAVEVHTQRMLQ